MALVESLLGQITLTTLVDIGLTALLIYWLFSLIQGTRAVRLLIGVAVLLLVYALAQLFDLRLLSQILQTGAVVGIFALVVIFQPELRRALERIGSVGSLAWLVSPGEQRSAERVASAVSAAASRLAAQKMGALIVIARETGLDEFAETGVALDAELSADLLCTIFFPRSPLHDGAVIVRGDRIAAAGATLPLAETTVQSERIGTRHRAALGITEQTDAVVVVVSEETGRVSLVERARIVRNLDERQLAGALVAVLRPGGGRGAGILTEGARSVAAVPGRLQAMPRLPSRARPMSDDPGSGTKAGGDEQAANAGAGSGPA
jgi:diadenylate cyclase